MESSQTKIYNLDYLKSHSPNNPKFVNEILTMFFEQIPASLVAMNKCLLESNWKGLHGNMHKIRPSIELVGMPKEVSETAKQIELYCKEENHLELIPDLFLKVEKALETACKELKFELT